MTNLLAAPGLTVIGGLVFAVLLVSVMSEAVTVRLPAVLSVTLKFLVPAAKAVLAGKVAPVSLEVIPTRSVTVFTRFQFASTALTVTVKAVPAVRAVGVPILPVAVPGAAVSPGTNNCSFANAPALTVTLAPVLAVNDPPASVAVMVRVPAVLKVKLDKVPVPAARLRLPAVGPLSSAMAALASEVVIVTLGVAVLTRFQLASTALTTMALVIAVPAVWAVGVAAVLPVAVPGAATSPGIRICSLVTAPALTVTLALVLVVSAAAASVAVIVRVPVVLNVKLDKPCATPFRSRLPAVGPLSSAMAALLSVVVMATSGVAL